MNFFVITRKKVKPSSKQWELSPGGARFDAKQQFGRGTPHFISVLHHEDCFVPTQKLLADHFLPPCVQRFIHPR